MSDAVEWSIHCCTLLAALPEDQALPAARLAEFHDVPPAYLAKALQALAGGRHRRVAPRAPRRLPAGPPAGGHHAARRRARRRRRRAPRSGAARSASAGPAPSTSRAPTAVPCGIARAMWRAEDAWRAELAATTVGDMVVDFVTHASPARVQRASSGCRTSTYNEGAGHEGVRRRSHRRAGARHRPAAGRRRPRGHAARPASPEKADQLRAPGGRAGHGRPVRPGVGARRPWTAAEAVVHMATNIPPLSKGWKGERLGHQRPPPPRGHAGASPTPAATRASRCW